ncbi:MAG: lipocalin family protein [Gemmatimonadota bacterium]|nr:lipocalin family protein [Gemmatimonadota bacterium]MDH3421617.1 lipocalin family protein [Gemmatimonadota bacterium]
MKPRFSALLTTLVVLSASGCGGDDPTGVAATVADMLGSWTITALTFTSVPPGDSEELISQGFSGEVEFRSDLTYTLSTTDPQQVVEVDNGTFSVSGSTLTLTLPGDVTNLTIQELTSTAATLYSADDSFDFNGDDQDTPATVTVRLAKQ